MGRESQLDALLGSRLRPASRGRDDRGDGFLFSAHGADGGTIGWVAVGGRGAWPSLGGLTVAPAATLRDARRLARSSALQLATFGSPRRSHHCVLRSAAQHGEFLEALCPLRERGVCAPAYTCESGIFEPALAARSLERSAAAATVAALGPDVSGAAIAVPWATRAATAAAGAAVELGAQVVESGPQALGCECDLLLVDRPLSELGYLDAVAVRARAVVLLHATWISAAAERVLRERGVVLVPDTLAAAGPMLAAALDDGAAADEALVRISAAVAARVRELGGAAHALVAPGL